MPPSRGVEINFPTLLGCQHYHQPTEPGDMRMREIVWEKLLAAERERQEQFKLTPSGQRSTTTLKSGVQRKLDKQRCEILAEVVSDAFRLYPTPFAAEMAARKEIEYEARR